MSYNFKKCAKRLLSESFFESFSDDLETLSEYRLPDKELAEMITKEGIAAMDMLLERMEKEYPCV